MPNGTPGRALRGRLCARHFGQWHSLCLRAKADELAHRFNVSTIEEKMDDFGPLQVTYISDCHQACYLRQFDG